MRIFRVQADRLGVPPPRAAMSFLSLAAIGTMAVGPLLGGILTGAWGWHSIFTINLPLSVLTAILVLLWTPKDPPQALSLATAVKSIDVIGLLLFAATLTGLMSFVMRLAHPIWWVLAITVALGTALVAYSRRRSDAFFDVRMLARNTPLVVTYVRACVLTTITYCMLYGFSQRLESRRRFFVSRWANERHSDPLHRQYRRYGRRLLGARFGQLRRARLVDCGGCDTFRIPPRHVLRQHASRGIYTGARKRDRCGRRPAAHRILSRSHHRRKRLRPRIRANRD